ncbi:interleukin-like EMT inducer domain-containing protein [Maribacter ulvicola]|uniref:Glycerophosphoryl diester phosphodiesterase n=1 Tax=Maribacter ulvicola TaxID=228959 RepID=A0A1N6UR62_9FLAO|nr:interleukin-like EMT inducer domain-containing protein [Maribacter ulvicola]SIQ68099.1 Glycerophosphoryl diester phosphodiesterase [Maribacter ulvicola]
MKRSSPILLSYKMVILLAFFFIENPVKAHSTPSTFSSKIKETKALVLNSHSFNTHERSTFTYASQTEAVERGLTIIHLQADHTFEFKTFDTYGSKEDVQAFIEVLSRMVDAKAVFALLAHDSAAAQLTAYKKQLSTLGFIQLSTLKGRQAYIMHNINGVITEQVNDNSITETITINTSNGTKEIYFPREVYEFESSIDRYIAHAGGEINGVKSTNSKHALDENYNKGFRNFELDIIETSDGKLVAAHDWNMWARFTDYTGSLPPTHAQFMKQKIYGDYTTLDMDGINTWFKNHPEATLITDKVNDPIAFADAFVDKDRLIMELFSVMAVEKASEHGIQTMISQEPLLAIKGDKVNFLKVNNVKHVAVSRRIIASQKKLMLELRDAGIKVYVFNVNFDAGKDEQYVYDNELGLVYGMYADKWIPAMRSKN